MCVPISFDFVPKVIFLLSSYPTFEYGREIFLNGVLKHHEEKLNCNYNLTITWNGKSVSYYGIAEDRNGEYAYSSPEAQFNTSGETYRYVAIG